MLNFLKQNKILTLFALLFLVFSLFLFYSPNSVLAGGGCSSVGQCFNNRLCVWVVDSTIIPEGGYIENSGGECGSSSLGGIEAPAAVAELNKYSSIGLLSFISKLVNFGGIVGGIIVVGNFLMAGLIYISGAGNADTHIKVRDKITYSIIGLVIMVSIYTIMGLIGLIFFKEPTFLLNPRLHGVL